MNKKEILKSIKHLSNIKRYKLVSYSSEYKPSKYICGFATEGFKLIYVKDLIFGKYLEHLNVLDKNIISVNKIKLKYQIYTVLLNDNFIFTGRYRGNVNLPKKYSDYASEKYKYIGSGVMSNEGLIFENNNDYIVVSDHLIQVFEQRWDK